MLFQSALLAGAFAATTALAQTAVVTIEASHGGAGSDLTNTTISIPLNTTYTNAALDVVSNLYLTSASGASLDSITCTPHLYANGTGTGGAAFSSSKPAYLSTNTVQVGSITCVSASSEGTSSSASLSSGTATPVSTLNGTVLSTTASLGASTSTSVVGIVSTVSDATSTFLTTLAASSLTGSQQSTVTSVMMASGTDSSSAGVSMTAAAASGQSASSTSSASASLTSGNAAGKLSLSEAVWPGLAIGALGLAMAV